MQKIGLFYLFISEISQFSGPMTRLVTPSFSHAYLKRFHPLLIFSESVSTCKNMGLFHRFVDLKILQSDWLRAFSSISQEKDFSQYRICAGTQQIRL